MHYKTNRLNHDFQIAYFIAGSCQTPDAAYAILCDLREDRSNAIKSFEAAQLRDQAKKIKAERMMNDPDEAVRLEGQADIGEMLAMVETVQKNYDAALAELAFIERCMEKLQPLRRFAHLPDAQAHEAAQQEEWKLQLINTAENHLLSQGVIPADHYGTMRMHPEFSTGILPALEKTMLLRNQSISGDNQEEMQANAAKLIAHLEEKKFDPVKLLTSE
jgi:hypothetical protein